MKKTSLLLVLPLLLAFRPQTFEPENFFWTTPTSYIDGTPLLSTSIIAYLLECASSTGGAVSRTLPGGLTSGWDVPPRTFDAGTWTCTLRTRAELDSDPSGAVEFVVANFSFTVAPLPPSGLGVG